MGRLDRIHYQGSERAMLRYRYMQTWLSKNDNDGKSGPASGNCPCIRGPIHSGYADSQPDQTHGGDTAGSIEKNPLREDLRLVLLTIVQDLCQVTSFDGVAHQTHLFRDLKTESNTSAMPVSIGICLLLRLPLRSVSASLAPPNPSAAKYRPHSPLCRSNPIESACEDR